MLLKINTQLDTLAKLSFMYLLNLYACGSHSHDISVQSKISHSHINHTLEHKKVINIQNNAANYIIALYHKSSQKRRTCFGAYLGNGWILTAAHCVVDTPDTTDHNSILQSPPYKIIFLDQMHTVYTATTADITQHSSHRILPIDIIIHPKYYTERHFGYDLALLYIQDIEHYHNVIHASHRQNNSVNLGISQKYSPNNLSRQLTFYGTNLHKDTFLQVPITRKIFYHSQGTMQRLNSLLRHIYERITYYDLGFSRLLYQEDRYDNDGTYHACKGDSGTPIIQQSQQKDVIVGVLVGLTTENGETCSSSIIAVNIQKNAQWIEEVIQSQDATY